MSRFNKRIVCCYLHPITKYGYPPPASGTIDYLTEMMQLGFQAIELEGIREQHLLEVFDQKELIKDKLEALGLEVPYFCTVLPGLSHEDKDTRKHNLELFQKGCEIASTFGALGVLDNGPLPPWIFPKDIPIVRHYEEEVLAQASISNRLNWDRYWEDLIETYQIICDIAATYDLTYQIHPAKGVLAANADGFLNLAKAVNRPNLRFNFDTANLFAVHENLQLSLIRLADHIDYIHISDNRGIHTEHLPIGDGKIKWNLLFETLNRIGFSGHLGIDIGGAESGVLDLDQAYMDSAVFISEQYNLS